MIRVRDLEQILSKFTEGQKGTAISDCPVFIETAEGYLEDVRRIEVQESVVVGDLNPGRLVFKCDKDRRIKTNQQSQTFKVT